MVMLVLGVMVVGALSANKALEAWICRCILGCLGHIAVHPVETV